MVSDFEAVTFQLDSSLFIGQNPALLNSLQGPDKSHVSDNL